jgi:SH3-like domain-containing protein
MCEHKQVSLRSEAEDFGEVQEQVEIDNARILFGGCDTQLCTVYTCAVPKPLVVEISLFY